MPIIAQSPQGLFELSRLAQDKGDFFQSEKSLLSILDNKENIETKNLIAVYNQLGIINKSLGRDDKAINYYLKAENLALNNIQSLRYKLPSIYNNIANVFKNKGDYKKALDYYNESINDLNLNSLSTKNRIILKAQILNNIGIIYYLKKDYLQAINYFIEDIKISKGSNHKHDRVYNNYANCLRELKKYKKAEKYYKKSIDISINIFGKDYYRLSYVYKDYGKLKMKTGNYQQALGLYQRALGIYKANFGEKHPFIAEMYEIIGDYYIKTKDYPLALEYYQKSLITNSSTFNSADIFKNPEPENIFSNIQLLQSLKKKSKALIVSLDKKKNKSAQEKRLKLSVQTLELAIKVLQNIRMEYLSIESKLYITKNGKEFYMAAIESSVLLYELTANKKYIKEAYRFSRQSKAAVLLNEIQQNEALGSILPDSLKRKKTKTEQNIAALKKLIFDEYGRRNAKQQKIDYWKSELFHLNKNYEELLKTVNEKFPVYSDLMAKTQTVSLPTIQNQLLVDETLIEYSYLPDKKKTDLYIFVVDHNHLIYHKLVLDSTFEQNITFLRKKMDQMNKKSINIEEFNKLNRSLYMLYSVLLKPVNPVTKNIIIVADEKIAYLPFGALISSYKKSSEINFSKLDYLVFRYRFSYSYSTNLLYSPHKTDTPTLLNSIMTGIHKKSNFVYAFAPDYHSNYLSNLRFSFGELKNARKEIKSVLKYFKGVAYLGDSASKSKFKSVQNSAGIFHLAMHANTEKEHPDYSFLAFSQVDGSGKDSYLYNYEISTSHMNASMVVLSACNTGSGKMYSGEGVMSLGRGFILAGASSVVQTLWEINDETSAEIMGYLYKYLSKGKSKSEALQLAQINYIENSSPELTSPVYWSGIVLMGNPKPLVNTNLFYIYSAISVLILIGLFLLFHIYRKKRNVQK